MYESLERDLVLVGITAIEDKLQVKGEEEGKRGDGEDREREKERRERN